MGTTNTIMQSPRISRIGLLTARSILLTTPLGLCVDKSRERLRLLRFSFQGALQSLIEGGLGALVFLLRDAALFVFHFELEDFIFQGFEQPRRRAARSGWLRTGLAESSFACANLASCGDRCRFIDFIFFQGRESHSFGTASAAGCLLPRGDVDSASNEYQGEAAQDVPAILLQRIGGVDGRSEAAAGAALRLGGGSLT